MNADRVLPESGRTEFAQQSKAPQRHFPPAIVTIALCVAIAEAENWNDIEEPWKAKEDFFANFLHLLGGILSHDTFNRAFAGPGPLGLRKRLLASNVELARALATQMVAPDRRCVLEVAFLDREPHPKWRCHQGVHDRAAPRLHQLRGHPT